MERSKILIVDDDPEIREILRTLLRRNGYETMEAFDTETAEKALETDIDLILLDVMLPELSGFELCRRMRQKTLAPILFLTALSSEADKITGLESGGDDYIMKPFSSAELISRIRAMLRRTQIYHQMESAKSESVFCFGNLKMFPEKSSVYMGEEKIFLTEMEYRMLKLFLEHPGTIFSAKEIFEAVWQEQFLPSSNNTVMVHIRNLRKKIGIHGEDIIRTSWGKGYSIG
ncbi:MAG: response regulator transcription factor [Eubacteriales bacterium]|nr:response regulator transcription factor [Eubacteriales bacterium]